MSRMGTKSFVEVMADTIFAQFPAAPLDAALALVSEVAKRQRLDAVVKFARGKEPASSSRADQVLAAVSMRFGVTVDELLGRNRAARLSTPRTVAWSIMRHDLGMSCIEIGAKFGRDHTTILSRWNDPDSDVDLAEHVAELGSRLRSMWCVEHAEAAE